LLVEGAEGIHPEQKDFVRSADSVKDWDVKSKTAISLLDIVNNAKPTVLIGTSGLQSAFTEDAVRAMATYVERPIIFPLSNPTSKSEAEPQQLLDWTDGKALIGTGSPFPPVHFGGKEIPIDQTNNSYIFPGMGLGILVSGAKRVTDEMFAVAGQAVAKMSPKQTNKAGRLLPPVGAMRDVSYQVALAVALQAGRDGVAEVADEAALAPRIKAFMWEPEYKSYETKGSKS
jgi:malate dehydrogenase (oxaloacetate-decarboxylating)